MIPNPAMFTRILGKILSVETTWCDDGTSNKLIESVAAFFKNSRAENVGTVEELIENEKLEVGRKEMQETRADDKKNKPKVKSSKAQALDGKDIEVSKSISNQDASSKTAAPSDSRTKYNRPGKNQKSTGVFGDVDALTKGKKKAMAKGEALLKLSSPRLEMASICWD